MYDLVVDVCSLHGGTLSILFLVSCILHLVSFSLNLVSCTRYLVSCFCIL